MEILFEVMETIVLDLGMELVHNKKISKWIRYPVGLLITMLYIVVVVGIAALGYVLIKEQLVVALFLWVFDLFIVTALIKKLIKQRK